MASDDQSPAPVPPAPAPVPPAPPAPDDTVPRETGSEKASGECPTCGGEVPVVETKYGSLVRGACPVCTAEDQLEAQKAAASS